MSSLSSLSLSLLLFLLVQRLVLVLIPIAGCLSVAKFGVRLMTADKSTFSLIAFLRGCQTTVQLLQLQAAAFMCKPSHATDMVSGCSQRVLKCHLQLSFLFLLAANWRVCIRQTPLDIQACARVSIDMTAYLVEKGGSSAQRTTHSLSS